LYKEVWREFGESLEREERGERREERGELGEEREVFSNTRSVLEEFVVCVFLIHLSLPTIH
jgi:hypothetical protein